MFSVTLCEATTRERESRGYRLVVETELLEIRDLGRRDYASALALQRELQAEVIAGRGDTTARPMPILLVEHDPPVITVSRRPDARTHVVGDSDTLARAGVELHETDRGGDVTYHGPGQLVVYPILDLNRFGLRLHSYMRLLEDVVLRTIACFGVEGHRDDCATGVWVGGERRTGAGSDVEDDGTACSSYVGDAKVCALGVRVSRWVSMHGLALNVTTDLSHFDLIVPCGLVGRRVTSLERELGAACPSIDDVKRVISGEFGAVLSALARPAC